jgi:hypothetical protein
MSRYAREVRREKGDGPPSPPTAPPPQLPLSDFKAKPRNISVHVTDNEEADVVKLAPSGTVARIGGEQHHRDRNRPHDSYDSDDELHGNRRQGTAGDRVTRRLQSAPPQSSKSHADMDQPDEGDYDDVVSDGHPRGRGARFRSAQSELIKQNGRRHHDHNSEDEDDHMYGRRQDNGGTSVRSIFRVVLQALCCRRYA